MKFEIWRTGAQLTLIVMDADGTGGYRLGGIPLLPESKRLWWWTPSKLDRDELRRRLSEEARIG